MSCATAFDFRFHEPGVRAADGALPVAALVHRLLAWRKVAVVDEEIVARIPLGGFSRNSRSEMNGCAPLAMTSLSSISGWYIAKTHATLAPQSWATRTNFLSLPPTFSANCRTSSTRCFIV